MQQQNSKRNRAIIVYVFNGHWLFYFGVWGFFELACSNESGRFHPCVAGGNQHYHSIDGRRGFFGLGLYNVHRHGQVKKNRLHPLRHSASPQPWMLIRRGYDEVCLERTSETGPCEELPDLGAEASTMMASVPAMRATG